MPANSATAPWGGGGLLKTTGLWNSKLDRQGSRFLSLQLSWLRESCTLSLRHFLMYRMEILIPNLQSNCAKITHMRGFPGDSAGKNPLANAGDTGSIPGSGRSPGEGPGNSLQYSRLGNPMDREAWWATVHGAAKSGTRLNNTGYHDKQPQTERLNKVWVVEIWDHGVNRVDFSWGLCPWLVDGHLLSLSSREPGRRVRHNLGTKPQQQVHAKHIVWGSSEDGQ